MEKILLTEDCPTIRGMLIGHEMSIFTAMAGMFDAGMPQQRHAKIWKWKQPTICDFPRPEAWKDRVKKKRRQKRARKSRRGF